MWHLQTALKLVLCKFGVYLVYFHLTWGVLWKLTIIVVLDSQLVILMTKVLRHIHIVVVVSNTQSILICLVNPRNLLSYTSIITHFSLILWFLCLIMDVDEVLSIINFLLATKLCIHCCQITSLRDWWLWACETFTTVLPVCNPNRFATLHLFSLWKINRSIDKWLYVITHLHRTSLTLSL